MNYEHNTHCLKTSNSRDSFPVKRMEPRFTVVHKLVILIKDNCLHICFSFICIEENAFAKDNLYTFEAYVILMLLSFVLNVICDQF